MAESQSEFSIPVPFRAHLQGKIQEGQTLYVNGHVLPGAKRFEINLLSGTPTIDPSAGNVVLHVSVRFDEGKIVLNSLENGNWGHEERHANLWKPDQDFDLRIHPNQGKFEIFTDREPAAEFVYRLPLEKVDYLEVAGDITLSGIHWGGRYYGVPYEVGFTKGPLHAGQKVYINGIPQGDRFNVDLLAENGDVLFHFNPRFDQNNQIVRNAKIGGIWGAEERKGPFPFEKEVAFDLVIINEPYSIQLYANKKHIGTFAHRTNNPDKDYVRIRVAGDVELTGLDFSH